MAKLGSLSAGRANKLQSGKNLSGGRAQTPIDQHVPQIVPDAKFVHKFTM